MLTLRVLWEEILFIGIQMGDQVWSPASILTSILVDTAAHCNIHISRYYTTLQHTATHCNTLQHNLKATHYIHHLSVNRWMDEFIHTMIYIHIHIHISISTYETCITSRVARLNKYSSMYLFVMPSCVNVLVCVCACVGVCVFVDACFTVAVQFKMRTYVRV